MSNYYSKSSFGNKALEHLNSVTTKIFKNHVDLIPPLKDYLTKVKYKDSERDAVEKYIKQCTALVESGKANVLNKLLKGKSFFGAKPDFYILERSDHLVFDLSYHFLRKEVFSKLHIGFDVTLIDERLKQCVTKIDILNKQISIDHDLLTKCYMESDDIDLPSIHGVILHISEPSGIKQIYYRIRELDNASIDSYPRHGAGIASSLSKFNLQDMGAKKHKVIMMIKKSAIKMYIREYIPDIGDLSCTDDGIPEVQCKQEVLPVPTEETMREIELGINSAEDMGTLKEVCSTLNDLSIPKEKLAYFRLIYVKRKQAIEGKGKAKVECTNDETERTNDETESVNEEPIKMLGTE